MAAMKAPAVELDLLIIGGGVAGLWTLSRVLQAGYSAILLEKGELGGGQSAYGQGIIHGGGKYAGEGKPAPIVQALAPMPGRWRRCLSGRGEIDLSAVRVLSDAIHVWSHDREPAAPSAPVVFGGETGKAHEAADGRPAAFAHPLFKGTLLRLDEPVVDIPSLFQALAMAVGERLFQADAAKLDYSLDAAGIRVSDPESGLALRPARILVTAGGGAAELASRLGLPEAAMQKRPLHMVAMRHRRRVPSGLSIYGHFAGADGRPMLTITTHPLPDGGTVWYLGGQLAEDGVARDAPTQIEAAKSAVNRALPWLPAVEGDWLSLPVSRAEPAQAGHGRPDGAFLQENGRCIVAWPTKLALAPDLADRVLAVLPPPSGRRSDLTPLRVWPTPAIAPRPWQRLAPCN